MNLETSYQSVSLAKAECESINRSYKGNDKFKALVDSLFALGAFHVDGYIMIEKFKVVLKLNVIREEDILWLCYIAVPEQYQNKGHATAFMKGLILLAEEKGFKKIYLSVNSKGPLTDSQLIKFYKKFGFKKVGYKMQKNYELFLKEVL